MFPANKKHLSGYEKRKKTEEQKKKLNEQLKKTPKLFDLGFTRDSIANQSHDDSPSSSASAVIAVEQELISSDPVDLPSREVESEVQLVNINKIYLGVEYGKDIGLWKNISNEVRDYWCARDPTECQFFDCDFSASSRQYENCQRKFCTSLFFRGHASGGKIKREWLMYSPSTGNIYCFPCVLLSESHIQTKFQSGFSDWKNAVDRLKSHENSDSHRKSVQKWISRRRIHGRIDSALDKQLNIESEYWIKVLQRVVSVIKFLSSRGLAFRGDNEVLGSQHNGNFLGTLELIAEYDPFLSAHIAKYGNKGKGKPSYLSSTICEEVIEILAEKVLKDIVEEIIKAKYFSLSVDSTPDISHTDQLTIVIRYVSASSGKVKERFLSFIHIKSHKGKDLATTILNFLEKNNINIKYLKGQSYDNAANMSGCYNGLQAHIKNINPNAHYVPCAAHSLNLVGVRSADSCIGAISFFGFLQTLYNFFSASTHRWEIMISNLEKRSENKKQSLVPKKISDTRWSARADACKALSKGYGIFQEALESICRDEYQKSEVVHEARCLLKEMNEKENAIMAVFWAVILERINGVNKSLQKEELELQTAVDLLKSLLDFLVSQRSCFDEYEMQSNTMTEAQYTDDNKRGRKRKKQVNDGDAEEVVLKGKEKFKVETYLPILDMLCAELSNRLKAYAGIYSLFGFLTNFLMKSDDEIKTDCEKFRENYSDDIEPEFKDEMMHFKCFILELGDVPKDKKVSAEVLFQIIFENMVESTFPNVMIALKIYRCLMITNATGERSFSKLKIIKNCLRSTMAQDRLNSLAIMAIEYDILEKIDATEIIKNFSLKKLRKTNV